MSPSGPPFGTSTTCGDQIVGLDANGKPEECDDGDEGSDACTALCQTRDQAGYASGTESDRYLGAGRHPISGLDTAFISTYVEFPTDEDVADGEPFSGEDAAVGATIFNIWGQPAWHFRVSDGASPIDDANPVAAALPNGAFAVAWGDFDGDGSDLGVALRMVKVDGSVGPLGVANSQREFSQLNPDMLWTGSQLVVAWEDYADAANGPDLRYRLFDADLNPLSDDTVLAASSLPEAAVALAPFNGGWAAAYREGMASGQENIVIKVGQATFRTAPVFGGPSTDRPALTALDATHLLVVFSVGTDPGLTGIRNVPRLRYAVIDTAGSTMPADYSVDPLDDVFQTDAYASHLSPSAVTGPDGVYLAWRSEARPGDAAGDQIWLKYVSWDPSLTTQLDWREPEMLIPRVGEGNLGDQRTPALAYVPSTALPPSGALAIGWDDYSHSRGALAGDPDVVVHYAPLRERSAAALQQVTQDWTGATGANWPANWTVEQNSGAQATINGNAGRILVSAGAWANGFPNDHTALDVDMVTKVTWNLNQATGALIARRADADPDSELLAYFSPVAGETWRIAGLLDGVNVNIQTVAQPFLFVTYAQGAEFFMRFRVANTPTGDIGVAAKLWLTDLPEPADWTLQATVLASSPLGVRLANRPGRFGVGGGGNQAGRSVTFDDFRANFYEGSTHGDLSIAPRVTPLGRQPALYRACTSSHQCGLAEGTCFDDTECATGMSCQAAQSEWLGIGSDASTCTVTHCGDKKRDADEPRVDCGGADCAPCSCPLTLTNGVSGYCSTTNNCLCGVGEGICTATSQCSSGLICKGWGVQYGLPGGLACAPYHCMNRVQDSAVGETGKDCGGDCGTCTCTPGSGSALHCRVYCPCPHGEGICQFDDDCQAGLKCGGTATGARFGLPAGSKACVKLHCDNNAFEAALGETAKDCGGECGTCP